jgi:hypothetical protein
MCGFRCPFGASVPLEALCLATISSKEDGEITEEKEKGSLRTIVLVVENNFLSSDDRTWPTGDLL